MTNEECQSRFQVAAGDGIQGDKAINPDQIRVLGDPRDQRIADLERENAGIKAELQKHFEVVNSEAKRTVEANNPSKDGIPLVSTDGQMYLLQSQNRWLHDQLERMQTFKLSDFSEGDLPFSKTSEGIFEGNRLEAALEEEIDEILHPILGLYSSKLFFDSYDNSAEIVIVSTEKHLIPEGWRPPVEIAALLVKAGFSQFWLNIYDEKHERGYKRGEWYGYKKKDTGEAGWGQWKAGDHYPKPDPDPQATRIRELEAEVLKFKCDLDWVADESKEYREKWERQCRLSMERLEEMRRLEAENARLVAIYAELREAVAGQSATLKRQANSTMLHTVAGEDVAALTALRLDEILTGKYKGIEEIDWLPAQSVVDELATVTARESALREAVDAFIQEQWDFLADVAEPGRRPRQFMTRELVAVRLAKILSGEETPQTQTETNDGATIQSLLSDYAEKNAHLRNAAETAYNTQTATATQLGKLREAVAGLADECGQNERHFFEKKCEAGPHPAAIVYHGIKNRLNAILKGAGE